MYSFEPTDEQKIIADAARKLALKEFRPRMRDADEAGAPDPQWLSAGWELGLLPASIPEKFGGFGEHSTLTWVLAAEELAWGDLSATLSLLTPNLVAIPVLLCGSPEQKAEMLPHFCTESFVHGSAALMEPRFDFNPNELRTRASQSNGDYVLSGVKCSVPSSGDSRWTLVYASLEGQSQAFVVEQGTPGFTIKEREQTMGMCAFPLHTVELDNCRIPARWRLGGERGCDFQRLLAASRVASSTLAVGVARSAYQFALDYAKQRKAFGEAIAQRQSIAFMLAEMATEIEASRMLVWEAAWNLDHGKDALREAYFAANYTSDMAVLVADRALQILGGYGFIRDYPVELYLRNARGFGVLEGIAIV